MAILNTPFISTLLCFSLISIFTESMAADGIAQGQTIRDGEAIVSAGESFELGFFSPGNSNNRYLGIWYKKVATGTVVWVANRESPLTNSTGVLELNLNGALVLLNHDNSVVWSSDRSINSNNPVIMQLLDSGNLVVQYVNDQNNENFLWQSFDHPGNTFIEGMKIGKTIRASGLHLSSWKSPDDPSQGEHTFEIDSSGLQIVIKKNSVVTARSGPWNGIRFSGMTYMKPNSIVRYIYVYNQQEKYYTYELLNGSVLSIITFGSTGIMHRSTWIDRTRQWNLLLAAPVDYCDTYALCGPYGSCLISNTPVCGCLEGFMPRNKQQWDSADWSSGCMRKTELDCEKGTDGFKKYTNLKLPDMLNWTINATMTLEECRIKCLRDCSCMAYSNSDIRGTGSGCFLWFGDLIDLKSFMDDGQDLYVRMSASELGNDKRNQVWIVATCIVSAGVLFIILGLCLFMCVKKRKRNIRQRKFEKNISDLNAANIEEEDLDLPHFDFSTIVNATDYFSFQNLLGEGGFGHVYKGRLEGGQEIAVKRLAKESKQGLDEFMNEVKCIAKLQHRNLVKLLGYCIEGEEKMLIYEYMPNKSLNSYIFDKKQSASLDWLMRFHIINGISRGLLYLHQDSRLRLIHRDLKLSNILLDGNMNPKISDFGMARSFGGDETATNTKRVVGTYGYMSPEYAIDGIFSTKSDIFSFGVLVLEIVSGKRNRGFYHPDHQLNLLGHAWKLFKEGRSMELIDDDIKESCNLSETLRAIQIGLLCVQHSPEDRPSISTVVLMLSGEGKLPEPKEPGFFTERKLIDSDTSSSKKDLCSINEVTITLLEAR